jgi:hypothetical protein
VEVEPRGCCHLQCGQRLASACRDQCHCVRNTPCTNYFSAKSNGYKYSISRTCGYFPGPHSQGAPYAEKEGDYQVSISSPIAATESSTTGTCQSSCLRRDYVHRCDSIRPVVRNRRHSTIPNRTADQFRKRHALTSCANIG